VISRLENLLGGPVSLEELKSKPGRRWTLRACGPEGTAIVKLYASGRAPVVARRVAALAAGPSEPVVPAVLDVDAELRLIVLTDVPGRTLREALLAGDRATCSRVGSALGAWHAAWEGIRPAPLVEHTVDREIEILCTHADAASQRVARTVEAALPPLMGAWACTTVVHRDLYEEQVLTGEQVGLIDVDDAALGPPELDLGNLIGHVELLERRRDADLATVKRALLEGYAEAGPRLDQALLVRCRQLTLLRLACLNDDPALVERALESPKAA
jgi:aminoglycoside phosphotransferase (APT) family kinase protein